MALTQRRAGRIRPSRNVPHPQAGYWEAALLRAAAPWQPGPLEAAALGVLADSSGIEYVFWICSFLPLLGLLTIFLPNMNVHKTR